MTNLDDFDRSLGSFLADGPTMAPEAPVVAALAHARTTPRRWDPLAALRRDVMARPFSLGGSRAGLVFAAVALVAASIGIAIVGSRPSDLTVAPSPNPSASPNPTSRTEVTSHIQVLVTGGQPIDLTVVDLDGVVADAVSVMPAEGVSTDPSAAQLSVDPADPAVLTVVWSGPPCQTRATMLVDAQLKRITIGSESCSGDSIALDRTVRLTFASPLRGGTWVAVVEPLTSGDGTSPSPVPRGSAPTTIPLGTIGSTVATLELVDQSGHWTGASVPPADQLPSVDFLTVTNIDDRTLQLVWPGAPCDTVHRLTIAADFGLTIDRPHCSGDAMLVLRGLRIAFDRPVDANAIDTALHDGRIGSGLPTWTAHGIAADGGVYDLAIYDDSGKLLGADPRSDGTPPPDPGPTGYMLDRISAADGRITWRAPACATSQTLRIDATAMNWVLSWRACTPADPATVRVLDLQFDQLPDTTGITVTSSGPES
jgi:hypothetical protein